MRVTAQYAGLGALWVGPRSRNLIWAESTGNGYLYGYHGVSLTAVWISPVVANVERDGDLDGGYHGELRTTSHHRADVKATGRRIYVVSCPRWPFHASSCPVTNDHFGSTQDLKDLSTALHARGMYLMVDVVS